MKYKVKVDNKLYDVELNDLSPRAALRAVCGWELGDGSWADTFIEWARACGYTVEEKKG